MRASTGGISLNLRLGVPKHGDFYGLAFDASVPLAVVVVGCATAVAIVGLATRSRRPQPSDALDAPTQLRRDALGA